jgi:FixJ family two-component response regulator
VNQPVAQVKSQHLLLVDDEENVLNALVRVLRRDGYTLYTAKSVNQAFEILANNPIEVVLSDQRMPEKNGTVFLSEVKRSYPNTVRLMLSGYTEVGAVTEAINEGAIYKFLTKPWDDGQLRANIREAFHRFEIEAQNQRLHHEIEKVNADLLQLNHVLEQELHARNMRIRRDSSVACVMQEIIDHLPLGVLGIDTAGELVWMNKNACLFLGCKEAELLGGSIDCLPEPLRSQLDNYLMSDATGEFSELIQCDAALLQLDIKPMGVTSRSEGYLILLSKAEEAIS